MEVYLIGQKVLFVPINFMTSGLPEADLKELTLIATKWSKINWAGETGVNIQEHKHTSSYCTILKRHSQGFLCCVISNPLAKFQSLSK
uniref:Uncharacterized protein n=1 Tax=Anguilla anguilla TaxID=7936 RepID=A0A0E9SVH1_ANGAN